MAQKQRRSRDRGDVLLVVRTHSLSLACWFGRSVNRRGSWIALFEY
jgi:hypothetical protein